MNESRNMKYGKEFRQQAIKLSDEIGIQEAGIEPLYLLYAYSHQLGVVIRQMECSREKTNEIPISKKLIEALKIKDAVITADAMLCQKETVKKITKGNDYILALKGNHPLYGTGNERFLS